MYTQLKKEKTTLREITKTHLDVFNWHWTRKLLVKSKSVENALEARQKLLHSFKVIAKNLHNTVYTDAEFMQHIVEVFRKESIGE